MIGLLMAMAGLNRTKDDGDDMSYDEIVATNDAIEREVVRVAIAHRARWAQS